MASPQPPVLFLELFPLRAGALPTLYAVQPAARPRGPVRAAWQHARAFGGRWAYDDATDLFVTDTAPPDAAVAKGLAALSAWTPTPSAQAAFAASALLPTHAEALARALDVPPQGNVRAVLEVRADPWVVQGVPVLGLNVRPYLVYIRDVAAYAAPLRDTRGLLGLRVLTRLPDHEGRHSLGDVVAVQGTVGTLRAKLLKGARRPALRALIERAAPHEPVLRVRQGRSERDYAASALWISPRERDYARLRVEARAARDLLFPSAAGRAQQVGAASAVLKAAGLIDDGYRSTHPSDPYASADAIAFVPQVVFGDGAPRRYVPAALPEVVREARLFTPPDVGRAVRVGVLNTLGEEAPGNLTARLADALAAFSVPADKVRQVIVPGLDDEAEALAAFRRLADVDVVLGVLDGAEPDAASRTTAWGPLLALKRAGLKAGVPTVAAYKAALGAAGAAERAALALAELAGGQPYALAGVPPYADYLAGLDILHSDTIAVATLLVWRRDGAFVGYLLRATPLPDATTPMPAKALSGLLPRAFFRGAVVVAHHTLGLHPEEADALVGHARKVGAVLHLVQAEPARPHVYALSGRSIGPAPSGTTFLLNPSEALVVTAAEGSGAPGTLHLVARAPFPAELAAHSVLTARLLAHTAKLPRLPRTLLAAARVRRLLAAGLRPDADEGPGMWWV